MRRGSAVVALVLAATGTAAAQETYPPLVTGNQVVAVEKGLHWLASTQERDGSWGGGAHGQSYPIAMTACAGVALLAGGNTPTRGKYAKNVRAAVEFLLARQDTGTGLYMGDMEQRSMYGHGYTMLFLAEVYGMTGAQTRGPDLLQDRIRESLVLAIERTRTAQTATGGFGYEANASGSDEGSVTVTQIQGIRACMNAGIMVPGEIIEKSYAYLESCQNPDGGIRYRAGQGGNTRPAITAAACASLYAQSNEQSPVAEKAFEYIKTQMLSGQLDAQWAGSWYFYTQFYMAQVLYIRGGADWEDYYPRVRNEIVGRQNADGSWAGDGAVGPTLGTAMAIVILQLPYQHVPVFQR